MSQSVTITFEAITCCRDGCGIVFGLEAGYYDRRHNDHGWFHCPNGHPQHYPQKSDLEKARVALQMERDAKEAALQRERSTRLALRAQKGQVTRLRRRAAAGVCPCCHRSFSALRRHMQTKHPEFRKDPA